LRYPSRVISIEVPDGYSIVPIAKSASIGGKKENLIIPPPIIPMVKINTEAATLKNVKGLFTDLYKTGL
jgi:hypothetical protein